MKLTNLENTTLNAEEFLDGEVEFQMRPYYGEDVKQLMEQ